VDQIKLTPAQLLALRSALGENGEISKAMGQDADEDKVSKVSVNYRSAQRCGTCSMYESGSCTLVSGKIDPMDVCDKWEVKDGAQKSAETPIVSTVHHPLGSQGLWHTPSEKVPEMQQLPAYFQNTARALMRDQGMGEQQAIATAVNAVKEWASGRAFGGKVKVTPQVRRAAKRALREWEDLKASHRVE